MQCCWKSHVAVVLLSCSSCSVSLPLVPWVGLWSVTVALTGHTHSLLSSLYAVNTPDRRQSKTLLTFEERGSKITGNTVGRQIAIESSVSNDFYRFLIYVRR